MTSRCFISLAAFALAILPAFGASSTSAADLKVLFMGDNGHHRPESRFQDLVEVFADRGIHLKYTDRMEDLNSDSLATFDGLLLYANIDQISDEQANAVLNFVAGGKGFIPVHCASYCWRNNDEIVALMGAQFQRHGGQVFSTEIALVDHPVMQGFRGFVSWDETYIHHRHNEENRTILEYRVEGEQAPGNEREPWTWVRTHGRGRVFYTAWGHDQRTFTHPGFHNLLERGIRWACGDDPTTVPIYEDANSWTTPQLSTLPGDLPPFEYIDVGPKIPNYTPGAKWGTQDKPRNMMQRPLAAAESVKHFVTPQEFSVRLYADERNFAAKPIAMTWDEQGRLWICETVDYPNELGGNRDRIRICEDTNGDAVADKFTVFAEELSIPTAIVIVRGGAVVQNGTETIYLKDTNGDDIADEKTVLITNWSLGDTHGGVSNFRYGLDNWIWAMQGYNNSTPHIDGQPKQTFRMGFWRFKLSQTDPPQVTDLEFIRSSNNNTWGLGISEEGLIFGSTANHNPSMFVPIPNRYYERVRGWAPQTLGSIADTYLFKPITDKIRQVDQFGGYTAAAGHALYTARAFPRQWWNKTAFVCGPTGHLVGTFVLRPDGANYTSTSPVNLLASDDEWSAPIMAEVGPDGAVWVIDWYNYIVQHNPTPQGFETGRGNAYESELRDKKHGRIYRVVPQTASEHKLHSFSNLTSKTNDELVQTLSHPSMVWRLQAQRLLIERNARDVFKPLCALVFDQTVDSVGLNVGAIHALQTLNGLSFFSDKFASMDSIENCLVAALRHPSSGVRRNAIQVLPNNETGSRLLLLNQQLFTDPNQQVQLQAMLQLSDLPPSTAAGTMIVDLASQLSDPVFIDALTSAAAVHAHAYFQALASKQDDTRSAGIQQVSLRVAEHVARGNPNDQQLSSVLLAIQNVSVAHGDAILTGLTTGLPKTFQREQSKIFDAALVTAFKQVDSKLKSQLIRLAGQCGSIALEAETKEIVRSLQAVLADLDASEQERIKASYELVSFRNTDAAIATQIVEQLNAQTSPELGQSFLQALQLSQSKTIGSEIVQRLSTLTPQLKGAAMTTLLTRADWAEALLNGVVSRDVGLSDLSLDQKQALRSYPDERVRQQATKVLAMTGGLPDANRDQVLQSLLHLTQQQGNADQGREMFQKHCAICHQHGDLGKPIGPNLTGMAVHPKAELLTHIIDPSRSVEGNFRLYTVVRKDGRVLSGMLASETRTSITLIDTKGIETSLPREDIEELLSFRKSLMPEGFEKQMTEDELCNLLEFLSYKGKYVPISLGRFATAISTKGLFSANDHGADRMIFDDWGIKHLKDVPFLLTNPNGKSTPNIIMLNGPRGLHPPQMPKSVKLPCNTSATAIHLLSGVGGWNYPANPNKTVSMIVRLHYEDGQVEDHPLINGIHFADYIRRVDVPQSEFAFSLGNQQIRYLTVTPKNSRKSIIEIELAKGDDFTAPLVMAVTVER